MEEICSIEKCTGCGVCNNVCPKKAIKMVERDDTGHFTYSIDDDLCIDCGVCKKKCPTLQKKIFFIPRKTFAAWLLDDDLRDGSSSGGVATAFYCHGLENGYHIVGTYMDKDFNVKLKVSNDIEDIEKFKGSKYVQAFAGNVYNQSLQTIQSGGKVCFIGTPCQCAAIRSVVGEKYTDNLLTVELICHGTPSQKIFSDHLHYVETKTNKKITNVSFRSEYGVEMIFKSNDEIVWKKNTLYDDFLCAFQNGIINNEACYLCEYAQTKRASDITIGDFMGLGRKEPFELPKNKVSLVLINSKKGEDFFEKCNSLFAVERCYEEAAEYNPQLSRPPIRNKNQKLFCKLYSRRRINRVFKAVIGSKTKKRRFINGLKKKLKEYLVKCID